MPILNRFKKALGIEGLKIELILNDQYAKKDGVIEGQLKLDTINSLVVQKIDIILNEKYQRGRKDNKLIDEMTIGKMTLKGPMKLGAKQSKLIDFKLPFEIIKSPMDQLEQENIFYKGIVRLAKLAKGAKSSYKVEAKVKVEGTVLDAVDSRVVSLS